MDLWVFHVVTVGLSQILSPVSCKNQECKINEEVDTWGHYQLQSFKGKCYGNIDKPCR